MPSRAQPCSPPRPVSHGAGGAAVGRLAGVLLLAGLTLGGCPDGRSVKLQRELATLRSDIAACQMQLENRQVEIGRLNEQLATARGLSDADLEKLFYPEKIAIDALTGGANYDGEPGDDGVTVYLKPVDRFGDIVKFPGDITVQLYDLAAAPGRNLLGEYQVPVDRVGKLWHGKLLATHYAIKCPWAQRAPEHSEVTVRVVFVDYLTKRVLTAQAVCEVDVRR